MRIWTRELGEFATNCYIIADPDSNAAAVVDPGEPDPWITRTLAENGLKAELILLTHGHLDHIGGVTWLSRQTGAPVLVHRDDAPYLTDANLNGSAYFGSPIIAQPPDKLLSDGDEIAVGSLRLKVIHTPGHTPGGVCFYLAPSGGQKGQLLAGDTLFAGSVGRTDLPGGSHTQLIQSIREKLLPLPPDTMVYPGHGPATTIGDEKAYNPFL